MKFSRRLVLLVTGLGIIILSIYYIIVMAPFQVIRNDYLGWMSQYTAAGALGIMSGIAVFLWNFRKLVL